MQRNAVACLGVLLVALAGCGGSYEETTDRAATPELVQSGPETGHVHAVGVDPDDGAIVVAAHSGLFRAGPGDPRASRLGDERRDVMGFTVEGPRRYAGSGHPDLRDIEAGAPTSVGFIRSTDGGRSWKTVSLEGAADLHVLEVAGDRIYGYDAPSGSFLTSTDGGRSWAKTAVPPILDVAVDPGDPRTIVASTQEGLLRSTDGGRSFAALDRTPPSLLVWPKSGLVRLGYDSIVRQADRLGDEPKTVGELPQPPAAASAAGDELLAAADDGSVLASGDRGRTWRPRLAPAS